MRTATHPTQNVAANESLRRLLEDPNRAYQKWQRGEAPYYEMCRAVVLAYCGREEGAQDKAKA
jgi:hypothetical protein